MQSASATVWTCVSVLLLGMSKGGLPVAPVALPILILVWPDRDAAARQAVAFMLPLLCVMDIVALAFYRRRIRWRLLTPLMPGMLAGVAAGSVLFVSEHDALLTVSDRALKLLIGVLGLLFVLHRAGQALLSARRQPDDGTSWKRASAFGFVAGITSTLAHAAGPVMQMFFLPQNLPKLVFAGTSAAFFFVLNLTKLVPFACYGRFSREDLVLGLRLLPLIPLGVAAGYAVVHALQPKHYVGIIYATLAATSVVLIAKALGI